MRCQDITCMAVSLSILFTFSVSLLPFDDSPFRVSGSPILPVSPPSSFTAHPRPQSILLTWEEPEIGYISAVGFSIYRSRDGMDFLLLSQVERDVFTFEDHDVVHGHTYSYFVRTDTDLGQSDNSNIESSSPDDEAPRIDITSPSEMAILGVKDVEVFYKAEDEGSGIERLLISLDEMGVKDVLGSTSTKYNDLSDGRHYLRLSARDIAGNTVNLTRNFIVDTLPPSLSIMTPLEGSIFSSRTVTSRWKVSEDTSNVASLTASLDNGPWKDVLRYDSWNWTGLSSGKHLLTLEVKDLAGNMRSSSVNFTVDLDDPDIKIVQPENEFITADKNVLISWMGHDATSEPEYRIRKMNEEWIFLGNRTEFTFENMPEGMSLIQVQIKDEVGRTDNDSVAIVIDRTSPMLSVRDDGKEIRSWKGRVEIDLELSDELSGVDHVEYSLNSGPFIRNDEPSKIILEGLDNGRWELNIVAYDRAENVASTSIPVIFDNTPPEILSHTPNGTISYRASSIRLEFSEEIKKDSIHLTGDIIGGQRFLGNTIEILLDQPLDFGRNCSFIISCMDLSGNVMKRTIIWINVSGTAVFSGKVIGPDGRALEDVKVTLHNGKFIYTDKNGNFIIEEKWGNVSFFFTRKGFQREELQTQGYPGRENWVGVIRMEKDDKLYVSKAFSFIGGPLDFLLILVLIILGLILSLLLWKIHENRKFQEVEVEWENDKQW